MSTTGPILCNKHGTPTRWDALRGKIICVACIVDLELKLAQYENGGTKK